MTQACRGLEAAHERGFVHRDIKPSNLFLHQVPTGDVVVKICDFGIVKRVRADDTEETAAQLTRTGGMVGSPAYMSPEQAKDARNIDLRTDIWSLGVSMFRALAGGLPWLGRESVGELIVAICTEGLPHVQDRAPWVPTGLAEAVHKTMRRDPGERFQSMAELAQALAPFTEGSTVVPSTDLGPVSQDLRGKAERRASPPDTTTVSGTRSQSVTSVPAEQAKRRRRAAAAVVGLVACGTVASVALLWRHNRAPDPAADHAATAPTAPLSGSQLPDGHGVVIRHVRVRVVPSNARVLVADQPVEVRDGSFELEGEPGASFSVVVSDGERKTEKTIVITKDGAPSLPKIELPEALASARRPEVGKGELKPKGATSATSTAAPAPTATSTPTSGKPKAKEDW